MNKKQDLTNQRFGMLTALSEEKERKHGKVMWLCKCDCGKLHIAPGTRLVNDKVHSCGCLRYARAAESLTKHGKRHSRLYSIWTNMRNRCNLESSTEYKRYLTYNGRTQCIADWADETGLSQSLIRQKIDKLHWSVEKTLSTRAEKKEHLITYKGKTQSIKQWADEIGIKENTLRNRIDAYGWSVEKSITEPVNRTGGRNG